MSSAAAQTTVTSNATGLYVRLFDRLLRMLTLGKEIDTRNPDRDLTDLRLERGLIAKLGVHFKEAGYDLRENEINAMYGRGPIRLSYLTKNGTEMPILYVPRCYLKEGDSDYVLPFVSLIDNFQGTDCRLISKGINGLGVHQKEALKRKVPNWKYSFVSWSAIDEFLKGTYRRPIVEIFHLNKKAHPRMPQRLSVDEHRQVVNIIAKAATLRVLNSHPEAIRKTSSLSRSCLLAMNFAKLWL